jgi:hypothetical protein
MSREFLEQVNGRNRGLFRAWLDGVEGEPRIAWYPSAGRDFRDLLYLDQRYALENPATMPESRAPDLFLHTNYASGSATPFTEGLEIHADERTRITVSRVEELPRCKIPLARELVSYSEQGAAAGRVFFMEVEVRSHRYGTYTRPVIYAFAENAGFCALRILPAHGRLSHIVRIRFGGGFTGGKASGKWLLNILPWVGCEVLVSDDRLVAGESPSGSALCDECVYRLYPELAGPEDASQLDPIRTIPGKNWSGYGDVTWSLFKKAERSAYVP